MVKPGDSEERRQRVVSPEAERGQKLVSPDLEKGQKVPGVQGGQKPEVASLPSRPEPPPLPPAAPPPAKEE
jgi:hypothetical protein